MLKLLTAMIILTTTTAQADTINVGSRVLCTRYAGIVQFTSSYNGDPFVYPELTGRLADQFAEAVEQPDMECNLGSANRPHMFRAKLGEIQKHHWGMCGAGQRNFISLWIGGHKIYSRKIVYDGCGWKPVASIDAIVYYDSTLLLCSHLNPPDVVETGTSQQWVCLDVSETYIDGIERPIDQVEYPPDGSKRREGHLVLLASQEDTLCSLLFEQFSLGRNLGQVIRDNPEDFIPVPWPWDTPVYIDMDINNDDLPDLIRKGINDIHGVDQTIVMVRDGRDRNGLQPDPPMTFDRRLFYTGETLFPKNKLGDAAAFDERNFETIVSPFIWRDETYVMMQAYRRDISPKWAVYQLQPNHTIDEICIIDRVPINY